MCVCECVCVCVCVCACVCVCQYTDCWQGGPGLVARGEEGETSWTFNLLPQFSSFRVHLGGGGSDHAQSVVDVH